VKILFVNNFRGRGGGEEFLRDLLPGLVSKGVKVGLVCRPDTPLVEMFRDSAIELHPIDRSGLNGIRAVFRTGEVIRQGGYEIIDVQRGHDIIQSWLGAGVSGARPVLMYTPQVPEFLRSRFLLSRMSRIVTISRHIRDKVVSFCPKLASRTSIIYYGIDLGKFRPENIRRGTMRERLGVPPGTPIIGTVGDLWKNQVEFLDALLLIRKDFPDARFALVASQAESPALRAFRDRAGVLGLTDALLWTGRLTKDEMLAFYSDLDLAVSTHRNEGFGIWVLEALAVGTPMISVNEGGIRDSLEGCPAGVLVDGGPAEMAAAVVKVLRDPVLRKNLSAAGPGWVADRYSRDRMVRDYHSFFAALINR
jgi:glycosyltransferase involved in cell wall biosynthesis